VHWTTIEFGIYTFAERTPDPATGTTVSPRQRLADLIEVIELADLLHQHALFGHQRFLLQLSVGTMRHDRIMRALELYGTKVAPAGREALGGG